MDTGQSTKPDAARARTTVIVALETLLGLPGHGQALLARFGLIPTGTAQRLSCDALVTLVLTHGDRVLNVGRTRRTVTGRQRTALATTHRTCAMPGCQVPFADCDIHHLWWWHLGGPTDHDLQVPLCATHHRRLHDGDYSLTRQHGTLVFRDPHGRTIPDPQHALTEQLDLLADARSPATQHVTLSASPYHRHTWGWTGQHPQPPPGHRPLTRPTPRECVAWACPRVVGSPT
jgi:hypothetical protein